MFTPKSNPFIVVSTLDALSEIAKKSLEDIHGGAFYSGGKMYSTGTAKDAFRTLINAESTTELDEKYRIFSDTCRSLIDAYNYRDDNEDTIFNDSLSKINTLAGQFVEAKKILLPSNLTNSPR